MEVKKGEATVKFSGWLVILGVLIIDNMVGNVCRLKALKHLTVNNDEEES